jgi:hypothetical protein
MSFMIGCGGAASKKHLEVKSFDEDTIFAFSDYEKAISAENKLIIETPPLLVEKSGEPTCIGLMEIRIAQRLFFIKFYSQSTDTPYTNYSYEHNMGRDSVEKRNMFRNKDLLYPYAVTLNIRQFNIGITIGALPSLGTTSGGIVLTLPDDFRMNYPDTVIHFGTSRQLQVTYLFTDLRQDYASDRTLTYSKEDLIQMCGNKALYEFQLPYDLLKDGNGLVFGERVYSYNERRLYGENPSAITLLPTIDQANKTMRYLCPSSLTIRELPSDTLVSTGTELSPTKSYSIARRISNDLTLTLEYTRTGSGINRLLMRTNKSLNDWKGNDINFVFVKRKV